MNSFRKSSSEADSPPDIANYAILQRIGRGGYGEVWLGRSVTGNLRAIKVVRRDNFQSERAFEREFEGIKRYEQVSQDHPGLVDILHVGRDAADQYYYYVMELADDVSRGREITPEDYKPATLIQRMRPGKKLSVAECVELGVTLAEALGRLHDRELAHRDVKPSNIIYVRGKPRLADPGLVAQSGQDTFVGTEGYVPPEGPGTAQADLYGLGMVLYEMNTGKDRMEFPELPTLIDPEDDDFQARVDLNTFICRACAPRPKQRFADAKAFRDALAKIGGMAAAAKPKGASPLVLIVMAVVFLAALGVGGMFLKDKMKPKRGTDEELALRDKTFGHTTAPVVPTRPPTPEEEAEAAAAAAAEAAKLVKTPEPVVPPAPTPTPAPTPPVEMANVPTPTPTPDPVPTPPAPPVFGSVTISTSPAAAMVYLNGRELGPAPYYHENQPAGDYQFTFKLRGYKDETKTIAVGPGRRNEVVKLKRWEPPIPGQYWKDSLGITFEPDGNGHRSTEVVNSTLFGRFLRENPGKEYPHTENLAFGIVYADMETRYAFCRWLTKLDREAGFLDEKTQLHTPEVVEPFEGSADQASFRIFVGEPRKGSIRITTNAEPADVFEVGETVKKIGATPFEGKDLPVGPFHYELRKAGYKPEPLTGEVTYPEVAEYYKELVYNRSVVFGQEWQNSLEMSFVPAGPRLLASKYETRVKDYEKFWNAVDAEGPRYYATEFLQSGDHPVVNVTYQDAVRFCVWLTEQERAQSLISSNQEYRLPTDLEWSHLAGLENEKGDTPADREVMAGESSFPWGMQWPPPPAYGNFADATASAMLKGDVIPGYGDGFGVTALVTLLEPNALGLHHLFGNVWEYVSDPTNGDDLAILRGGGWMEYRERLLKTAARNPTDTDTRDPSCGFRVVLSEKE